MVDPSPHAARRRAHLRVGAAATATFLLFLLLGVLHRPAASADPTPAAAPAVTATPTPDDQQQQPFPGRRGGWHRGGGYGDPSQGQIPLPDDQGQIPLPDDGSGPSDQFPSPDESPSQVPGAGGGQVS